MIDHLSLGVSDLARAAAFYDAALAPLGYRRLYEQGSRLGYGRAAGEGSFWIGRPGRQRVRPMPGLHVAFAAADTDAVDDFYAEAIRAGAADNGAPGLRTHIRPATYAAFVIDPDGHHLEAVCRVAVEPPY